MTLDELIKQQRIALQAGKCEEALCLLDSIAEELDKANAWTRLRKNEPVSDDELIQKFGHARAGLAPSGRSELDQLARVCRWCDKLGVELSTLGLPKHLHKYREAAGKLNDVVDA